MWSPVCVMGADAPEKASVTILDLLMLLGRSMSVELTMWPSAPQSMRVGVRRSAAILVVMTSGGYGGGFRLGGVLALTENVDDLLGWRSSASLPQ